MGIPGAFSTPPLRALLAAGFEVRAVWVPAAAGRHAAHAVAPLAAPPVRRAGSLVVAPVEPTVVQLAHAHDIPVYEVARMGASDTLALLRALTPDALCVACWAWRVPPSMLALPPLGVLNLHPSLLPARRGPDPLFWTLRDGEHHTGVTVHQMDHGWDTGPLLVQLPVVLDEGASERDAERRCAERGGEALVHALHGLAAGTLVPQPQPPGGTHAPLPTPDDFALDIGWSAQRAYTFMRGTAGRGVPFRVRVGAEMLTLRVALDYAPDAALATAVERHPDHILIQFSRGVLRAVER
jgi:methionyl-tRNA formyltransferase